MTLKDLITVGPTARLLECCESTARRFGDTGKLTVLRTSTGVRLFSRGEVEKLKAERLERRGR